MTHCNGVCCFLHNGAIGSNNNSNKNDGDNYAKSAGRRAIEKFNVRLERKLDMGGSNVKTHTHTQTSNNHNGKLSLPLLVLILKSL